MARKKQSGSKRVVVSASLSPELAKRLREYGRSHALNKSAVISTALKTFMDSEEMMPILGTLSQAFSKIAETGNIDATTTKQIQAFNTLVELMEEEKK